MSEYDVLAIRINSDGLLFRALGYGLRVESRKSHTVLFSERAGYRKVHYVGPIIFEFLGRRRPN